MKGNPSATSVTFSTTAIFDGVPQGLRQKAGGVVEKTCPTLMILDEYWYTFYMEQVSVCNGRRWVTMNLALRIVLGLILAAASISKFMNLEGFEAVLHSYRILPQGAYWPAALAISASELALGLWLLWGRHLRLAAFSSLSLHCTYAILTGYILLRGIPIINCGCFGAYFARPLSWMTAGQNLLLASLSFALARLAVPKDEQRNSWWGH